VYKLADLLILYGKY